MRKEIRELLQREWGQARARADMVGESVRSVEGELANLRMEYNDAENLVRLIEEELKRPDGSPAAEKTAPVVMDEGGTGI